MCHGCIIDWIGGRFKCWALTDFGVHTAYITTYPTAFISLPKVSVEAISRHVIQLEVKLALFRPFFLIPSPHWREGRRSSFEAWPS